MSILSLEEYTNRLKELKGRALKRAGELLEVGEVDLASNCLNLIRLIDDRLDNM